MTANPDASIRSAVWDGPALLSALHAASEAVGLARDAINALNVFPVPDGDTGTNMALTMRAAVDEATASAQPTTVASVADRAAYGALLGARGNSGVILSQILRGFARPLAELDVLDGRDLARALCGARDTAYRAVMKPVEGTMLTVIRIAAERAETAASRSPLLSTILAESLAGAREALDDTPNLLDLLRQANVVDAGGQGVVVILDALDAFANGRAVAPATAGTTALAADFDALAARGHGEDAYGYCTNFMVAGVAIPFDDLRASLAAMGESAVIVGDDRLVKVHIHSEDPGAVLSYAVRWGDLSQIKIDNMTHQNEALRATPASPPRLRVSSPVATAVVAVSSGDGVAEILRSLGVMEIVEGGQTMNPSIQDLLSAVERQQAQSVIVLPNNGNIVMAANQLPELTLRPVRVVPTRSIPQGLAAMTAFLPDRDLSANIDRMSTAAAAVRTVEITAADKDANIDGVEVRRGQVIALIDDRLVCAGDDIVTVTLSSLVEAGMDAAEVLTILVGACVPNGAAGKLESALTASYPDLQIEALDGGQPHYAFLIAVE